MTAVKMMPARPAAGIPAEVYCPICTHTVPANVTLVRNAAGKRVAKALTGQRCPRCHSSLDAAFVIRILRAA